MSECVVLYRKYAASNSRAVMYTRKVNECVVICVELRRSVYEKGVNMYREFAASNFMWYCDSVSKYLMLSAWISISVCQFVNCHLVQRQIAHRIAQTAHLTSCLTAHLTASLCHLVQRQTAHLTSSLTAYLTACLTAHQLPSSAASNCTSNCTNCTPYVMSYCTSYFISYRTCYCIWINASLTATLFRVPSSAASNCTPYFKSYRTSYCISYCTCYFMSYCTCYCIWINESSVNPKSTSNQSSKPCTVLQYPSKKVYCTSYCMSYCDSVRCTSPEIQFQFEAEIIQINLTNVM